MEDIKINCVGCKKEFVFSVKEQQFFDKNEFQKPKRCLSCREKRRMEKQKDAKPAEKLDTDKNYAIGCMVCGEKPTVGESGLCGPCCFGEAATIGGNW